MVKYNKIHHVIEEHAYKPNLQDVDHPNLHRKIFTYGEIPKTTFNMRHVPMECPRDIYMTDTTFRDGQQACKPFSVKNIVDLYKMMHRLGGPNGLIRQSEFFLYSDKDKEALVKCQELGYEFPEVTAWIRANEKDFELVKQFGLRETGILVSCSDYHIFKKMNMTRAQALDKYLGIVKSALSLGIVPRCHFEDITRADYFGFVVPFAIELMKLSRESGVPIKIRACDTMGYGVTYPGTALPRSVQGIIYGFRYYAEIPSEQLEWHGHNDFYKAVVNSATAWLHGCSAVNTTLLGIGERTGNTPLEAMAIEYTSLRGTPGGMDLTVISEIADYFEHEMGMDIPERTPFVGRNFNVTKAGIHADGMLKDQEIYNIFDTEKILGRPARVVVDSFSGLAGIAFWINSYYGLKDEAKVDKKHPAIALIKEKVDEQYALGRTTVISDGELDAMLREADPELYAAVAGRA
ncbi:MAG TPA: 2-isopropylmalate synthase [Candidatus Limadaptatus stercoripullorum]|uniref:2-isopropylmalate synthase n=1 Tax=Candidatus Limadaptatus stercoripullorum TaxID=2840846 RepID=A0A9D1NAU6_9FIRM|nr:2-isopropylmalate synthase [Candidatus Limadaptatus stercoripullorum]